MKKLLKNINKAHRKLWSAVLIPSMIFNKWRIFFYRLIGYKNISKKAFIGMRCYLDDMEPKMLFIEEGAKISCGVFMTCHGAKQHHYPIIIKKDAYVGMRTCIITRNGPTVIGEHSFIGANAVVNKSVPDFETWAGVPAKKIK